MGIGWYWFGPVAYVDTSDMWLEGRWPRIAVSIAGPYANLVLGGLAALVADGYHVLSDLLDRPNLRPRALA